MKRIIALCSCALLTACSFGTSADLDLGQPDNESDLQMEGEAGIRVE